MDIFLLLKTLFDKTPTRNHLEILDDINKLLSVNGLHEEKEQLELEISASFTGSELCLRSASKLLTLQDKNKQVNKIVGHLTRELVSYCRSNGLYPKVNHEA
ncbi:MAG: hypothetical protein ABJB11_04895 [Ferruginibacter sp.]